MFSRAFEPLENLRPKAACMLPNVARYQLRHTPKCEKYSIFRSISVSGQICGQTAFLFGFRKWECVKKSMLARVFERLKNQEAKAACMLPNQARYQLRHTPLPPYYISTRSICQENLWRRAEKGGVGGVRFWCSWWVLGQWRRFCRPKARRT